MNTLKFGNGEWYGKKDTILAYNDENYNYKPLPFDFSRASSATVVNKDGLIETVGSGEPRIDYKDDSKGALLLEPQRTNLIAYSEAFDNAYWTKTGSSATSGFLAPDGTTNAYKLVEGTNNGEHIIYKISIGVTSGATLSYSFFAKKGERNVIQTYNYVGGGFQNGADFDLSTGVVSNQYGGLGSMTELDNGWWRCDFTSLALVGQTGTNVAIRTLDNSSSNSYQGDGTSGFYIYGAQIEDGSYATSYIPTSGSAVTRLAESCSQTPPDGVIGQTEGVLYVDFKFKGLPNNVSSMPISIDGSGSNEAYIYIDVNNTVYGQFIVGGSFTCNISGDNLILGNTYKIAFAYKNSDFALFVNGVLSNSSNSGAVGANQNIVIGNYLNGNYPHDNINEAKLYNTRLTNAELEALTQV